MTHRRTAPSRLPEGGGFGPDRLSLGSEFTNSIIARARKWLPGILATLTMVIVGTINGWTNISFHRLTSGNGDVPLTLTRDEYSWSVCLTVLSSMIGALVAAKLADRIGRKYCLLLCSAMFTFGWLEMYIATSVQTLYLARGILGIGVGIARTINPMFVSEVTDIEYRGFVSVLITMNVYTGSLLTYAIGDLLTYTSHLLALIVTSGIFILPLMCLRETPYFLVAKGQKAQARKSIAYYKGIEDPERVKIELRALRAEARYGLHQQSRSDLSSESGSDLHPPYRSNAPPPYRIDAPPPYSINEPQPYSINLPSPSRSDSPPPYSCNFPSPSSSDLLPLHRSNLPSQSIREIHSDHTREVVGTEATSNLHLPSSSDSPSQSTSSVQSKFKREVNIQLTGELRVEYSRDSSGLPVQISRELHSQSTNELHRPSTSEVHRPSTSEVHRPSTSEVHRPSTSEVHQPSTSKVHPPPTSEVHRPSTSEVHRPSTSEVHRPSTSELHSQSTSELHRPSTSEVHRPSTIELHSQTTSELHPPSTSDVHRPSTSELHRPSTSEIHTPSTSEVHPPSTSEVHQPSRSEVHQPSRSEVHQPSRSEVHQPSTSEVHQPSTSEVHQPSTSEVHQPSTSEVHRTPTSEVHRPPTSEVHSQTTSDLHTPSTSEVRRPSTSEVHSPSTSEVHRHSTSEVHQPSTSEVHPTFTSEVHRPSTSEVHRPSTSELHSQSTSELHRPSTSEVHGLSTSEISSDHICEIQSRSRSDLRTQPTVYSQASTAILESHVDGTKYTCLNKLRSILQGSNRRALLIMLVLIMAQQLGGNFVTMRYLEVLFSKTTIGIESKVATILVLTIDLTSGTLSTLTVDCLGRRKLLIVSTLGSCLTLTILATYLLFVQYESGDSFASAVPIADLIIYEVMFQIGLGTLPNVLLCDLFPTKLKGFVGAIVVIFDGAIVLIGSLLHQVFPDIVTFDKIYFLSSISCAISSVMVALYLPETKGKTYHEIEPILAAENLFSLNEEVRTDEMDINRI